MRLIACAALLIVLESAAAANGPGSTSGEFLRLDVGARAAALGGAYVGLADDVDALYYNPAGLGLLPRMEVSLAAEEFGLGVHHEWLAASFPTQERGVFATGADILYVEPFAAYDEGDQPIGKVSAMEGSYALAYSYSPAHGLSFGGSGKMIRSRLDNAAAATYAADAGFMFKPFRSLSLGASLLNVGPGLRYSAETNSLPTMFKAGAAYRVYENRRPSLNSMSAITIVGDATIPRDQSPYMSGGIELVYADALALRVGGKTNADLGLGVTAGVAITIVPHTDERPEIDFEYAFTDMGMLTQSHRGGIKIKFGRNRNDAAGVTPRWELKTAERRRRSSWKPKPRARVKDVWTDEGQETEKPEKAEKPGKAPEPPAETPGDEDLLKPLIWVTP